MIRLAALACGLLCGLGLVLSGLHDPAALRALAPAPDLASLGAVIATFALIVAAAVLAALPRGRGGPLLGGLDQPAVDGPGWAPLAGALVFGLGWGLAGYVPMTALVSAGTRSPGAAIFLIAVLAGMVLSDVAAGDRGFGSGRRGSVG